MKKILFLLTLSTLFGYKITDARHDHSERHHKAKRVIVGGLATGGLGAIIGGAAGGKTGAVIGGPVGFIAGSAIGAMVSKRKERT